MKKTFIVLASLSLFVLASCGGSTKGNWSDDDKERAREELNSERDQMEVLIGKEKTDAFIDCAMEKIEANYENFEAADSDIPGMEKIGEECMTELL